VILRREPKNPVGQLFEIMGSFASLRITRFGFGRLLDRLLIRLANEKTKVKFPFYKGGASGLKNQGGTALLLPVTDKTSLLKLIAQLRYKEESGGEVR
jgi:hypothetical protein